MMWAVMSRPAARALRQSVRVLPDNPSRHEVRRRGPGRQPRGPVRRTPVFVSIGLASGQVAIGFEAGTWAAEKFAEYAPGVDVSDVPPVFGGGENV